MKKLLLIVVVTGCALKGALMGGTSVDGTSSTATAGPTASQQAVNQPTAIPVGLSEYATRFVRWSNELKEKCPAGPTAPSPDYSSICINKADSAENLYKSVDEKSNPQVQEAVAYLAELRKSLKHWDATAAAGEAKRDRDSKMSHDSEISAHNASELLSQLGAARAGKITSTLISFDNRDAGYVAHRVGMLKQEMPDVADIAKGCGSGVGTKDLCDLAINRDTYFAKLMALQFDAIVAERLQAWTSTINGMKDDGLVAVVNYNEIGDLKELGAELGGELGDIGKALGQTNTKATIAAKLEQLHRDFLAAVKSKESTNAWAAHAKDAKFQDAAATKAVRQIDGLSLVRMAANDPTWEVIRGDFNQPVQRNRYVWALMRKGGESFCRLYAFTVAEDHMGGGRYGEPRVQVDSPPEFYVSTCK